MPLPSGVPSFESLIDSGARVVWVAAHPDDESMAGPLLARACVQAGAPCLFVVLTRGGGGECGLESGCHPDLATVRSHEMEAVAALYGAELRLYDFYNAPLPVESFPERHVLAARWREEGDPARQIARDLRRFQPDLLLTFHPDRGFTCHPEHQLAARFALQGIRLAADASLELDALEPWRVSHAYYVLNKHWLPAAALGADPGPYTDEVDTGSACANDESCGAMAARFTYAHRTQAADMGSVRLLSGLVGSAYLRHVDPWGEELPDPAEPAPGWCP